jgi:aryl-alcohol dehydrogenase-like predicted oxidoreductase
VFPAVQAWAELAQQAGLDPVVMALAWHTTRPFTSVPILGATTLAQLERQMPALHLTLPADLVAAIDRLHAAHPMPF